jgi:serine/threonine protein phosphatase 1
LRTFLIGDIHGCVNTFDALLSKIGISREDHIILLGDYVDRGLFSKQVIDKITEIQDQGFRITALKGNHEEMFVNNYLAEVEKGWHQMGDDELLQSFGKSDMKSIPKSYIEFCDQLPLYHADVSLIAVHAGLDFGSEDHFGKSEYLLWSRDWYSNIDYNWLNNRIIVHGHTPRTIDEIKTQFGDLEKDRVLNIDGGAFLSEQKLHGLGHLCAFDYTNMKLIFQENVEIKNQF